MPGSVRAGAIVVRPVRGVQALTCTLLLVVVVSALGVPAFLGIALLILDAAG